MKSVTVRGVPQAMRQDGWWLDNTSRRPTGGTTGSRLDWVKSGALVALIALADLMVWGIAPGISLAVLGWVVFSVGLMEAWPNLAPRMRAGVAAGTVLSLLPLVELVQPLSVLIAVMGLAAAGAALAGLRAADVLRGAVRIWWVGPAQSARDGVAGARQIRQVNLGRTDLRSLVVGWALPFGATLLFALLLIGANPVLDQLADKLGAWQMQAPNLWRLWFWAFCGVAIWPILVAWRLRSRLEFRRPARHTVKRDGVVNALSVSRSLVAFNALFAVQTGMDVLFLYGNVGLPEGISAATYAHRGAYPLLVTALLAGLFAVLARPHLAGRPVLRWLMMVWLAQTLALVFAALWRLDTYVDIYGLTRLRLAAYIWMGLVAAGLCIVVWQIWQDRPAHWMIVRSAAMGLVVLYLCAFVNFDGIIAEHNLTQPVKRDSYALCQLSEGALPAMVRHWKDNPVAWCNFDFYVGPRLFHPADWREWGFRNWRVRRSLAAMQTPVSEIPVP